MTNIEQLYNLFLESAGICTDSRRVTKNTLFFALKGENFDGNMHAVDALEKGCKYAIVDDINLKNTNSCIVVDDVLKTLQKLALYHRKKLNIPILAITGTNGKTTTKELVATILAQKYRVAATKGNFNNHIGVPLTLLRMNNTIDYGIVELGASSLGEIAKLCEICAPNYGLITNVGKAHLKGFGSFENIQIAKAELYRYIQSTKGVVFLNKDNQLLKKMIGTYSYIDYGTSPDCYCYGNMINKEMYVGINWTCQNNSGNAYTNLIGTYNFENILAAVTVGNFFNVASSLIDKTLSTYLPRNNRSQLVRGMRNILIMDLYNANPTSMQAAIDNFNDYPETRKALILGDMLELGEGSDSEHEKILKLISQYEYSEVYLVGKKFAKFKNKYPFLYYDSAKDLSNHFLKHPLCGRTVLIKGSRGIQLEKCTDFL
jgi:UDP-N-acetylmuramoyl-tripeptide--D-alanyl-D-alanine ligase